MTMTKFPVVIAIMLAWASPTIAQIQSETDFSTPRFTKAEMDMARQDPGRYTINPNSIRVNLIAVEYADNTGYVKMQEQPGTLNGILVSIEKIVNIAEKVWKIVEANRPVVNIDTKYATAYPEGITSASQLAFWSRPKVYTYGFYAENLYGATTINVRYKVAFAYNGNYKGKGKYLTAVSVIPTTTDVSFGYKFYMNASVPDSTVTNVGSTADPVAAMQMKLAWKIATMLKESDGTSVYYVQGDGYFQEIASPWKGVTLEEVGSAAPLLENPENVFTTR